MRERRLAIVDALKSRGANLRIVNGGGTGSLDIRVLLAPRERPA